MDKHKQLQNSLWLNSEFFGYYMVIFYSVIVCFQTAYRFSSPSSPNYSRYKDLLSESWISKSLKFDNSDLQYSSFRSALIQLSLLLFLYLLIKAICRKYIPKHQDKAQLLLNLSSLYILHGNNVLKILLVTIPAFFLGKRFKSPAFIWAFIVSSLFVIEWYTWKYESLNLQFLDQFLGFYPRWNLAFKISCLRIISFIMDYCWFETGNSKGGLETNKEYKYRLLYGSCSHDDFSLINFFNYVFYLPLYLAGPIMTFNDFVYQSRHNDTVLKSGTIYYGIRFIANFLLLELILHLSYPVAIKQAKAFDGFSPKDFGVLAYLNLNIVWLKLLNIWRFFRLIALIDGIEPPENMVSQLINQIRSVA